MPGSEIIRIVAAVVMNDDGQTLLVRKRGTASFMQPGGKLAEDEQPFPALEREIREELGCAVRNGSGRSLGRFCAIAANEPDCTVDAELFAVTLEGDATPQAEIEEAIWIDPARLEGVTLAPLTAIHAMPLALELKG